MAKGLKRMRITLAVTMLCAMVASGIARSPAMLTAAALALQPEPPTNPPEGKAMGATEIDLVKWGFTQGGLTLVLIITLASYRRDFFRKNEAKQAEIDQLREDKRVLAAVLDRTATAMTSQAVALERNTKATELLAQNVNNLAERRSHGAR